SAKSNGVPGMAGPYAMPAEAGSPAAFPLAAADLNGDGGVDFVVPEALVISGAGGYAVVDSNAGAPRTQAARLGIDADGPLDVAAGSTEALDIDFLVNAGDGLFNPSTLPTEGPSATFAVGDFDGDLVDDLAFTQALDNPAAVEDDLSVA